MKWVNRFAPVYSAPASRIKLMDVGMGTILDATGLVQGLYEEVILESLKGPVKGWVHTDDLEDYVRNFPVDVVVIENQTPVLDDFQQYMVRKLIKQVNMCGELCAAYIMKISLGTLLDKWEIKTPSLYNRIFGGGRARGTGAGELTELFTTFERNSESLATALYQPHIKRSRYTIKSLNKLMAAGKLIVSVKIDGHSGLLRGSGILHWIVLINIISERNGQGMVTYYNPAMNCVEVCSWNEFVSSAGFA